MQATAAESMGIRDPSEEPNALAGMHGCATTLNWGEQDLAERRRAWPSVGILHRSIFKVGVVWHLTALGLVLGVMMLLFPTTVTGLVLQDSSEVPLEVPHAFGEEARTYSIEGTWTVDWRPAARHLTLRADDCVEAVTLDGTPIYRQSCGVCVNCAPFKVNLPETVGAGEHAIALQVRNLGGPAFFDLRQAHGFGWGETGITLLVALGWLAIVRRRRMPMAAWWLVVGAMLLAIAYHSATDFSLRQHDVEAHEEYVQYLLQNGAWPNPNTGWETHQPPLYYALSLVWIQLGEWLNQHNPWPWLQWLAAIAYVASIGLAALVWPTFKLGKQSAWLGLSLFAFLPMNLFISARIGPDALLPFLGVVAAALFWNHIRQGMPRNDLGWLALLLLVGLMVKLTFLAILGAFALLFPFLEERVRREQPLRAAAWLSVVALPALLWLGFWGARSYAYTGEVFFTNSDNMNSQLMVPNTAYRYVSLDYHALTTDTFPNPWQGALRESLPSYLLGTALFGEFGFDHLHYPWASFLPAVFLVLAAILIVGLLRPPPDILHHPWLLLTVLVASQMGFFLVFNWRYPYAPTQDARNWALFFFPLALLWSWGYEACLNSLRGIPHYLVQYSPIVFFALLAGFYVYLLVP